jgi:hypothetical protein
VSQESLTATELDPSKHLHQKTALRGFEVFQAIKKTFAAKQLVKILASTSREESVNCLPTSFDTFQTELVYSSSVQ